VAGVVEDMLTASKAGDVEALSGLLHEECIAIVPQAGVVRGDGAAALRNGEPCAGGGGPG
jgi:hypothetical protein